MSSENTEKYIDNQTGMFNQYALGIVIREFIETNIHRVAAIISLGTSETQSSAIDWRSYVTVLEQLQQFCVKEYKRQVYRIGDNGFVLLAGSEETAQKYASEIVNYTQKNCSNNILVEFSTLSLSNYTDSDIFMSQIIDICVEAINKSAGDELIQAVARLLCDTVGNDGWVFRQGGDEFAILWKGNDVDSFLSRYGYYYPYPSFKPYMPY